MMVLSTQSSVSEGVGVGASVVSGGGLEVSVVEVEVGVGVSVLVDDGGCVGGAVDGALVGDPGLVGFPVGLAVGRAVEPPVVDPCPLVLSVEEAPPGVVVGTLGLIRVNGEDPVDPLDAPGKRALEVAAPGGRVL